MPRRRRLPNTHTPFSIGNATSTLRSSQAKLIQDNTQDTQDCQVSSTTTTLMQEIQNFPIVTNLQLHQNDPDLDSDKKTIINHPLYPLLAALLQQCELASARPDSPPPIDAFTEELRAYVQRQFELEDAESVKCKLKDRNYYPNSFVDQHGYSSANGGCGRLTRAGSRYKQADSCDLSGSTKSLRPQSRDCRGDKSKDSTDKSSSLMDLDYTHDSSLGQGLDLAPFEEDRKLKVFVNDRELDELIVKAIQVLRIHLLELHKVNELCKDFCSRYIHSLKTKFQTDPMIQDSQPSSPGDSEVQSPGPTGLYSSRYFPGGAPPFMCQSSADMVPPEFRRRPLTILEEEQLRLAAAASSELSGCSRAGYPQLNGHGSYGATGDISGMCYTPNYHLLDYGPGQFGSKSGEDHGDTFGQLHPFLSPYSAAAAAAAANSAAFHARLDNLCVDGKQKRGVLPKRATQIMKQWLFQHLVHPYPTEDEKRQIASQTNLTLLQVNNWFINARRRILQPMLDASNFVPLGTHCGDGTTEGGEGQSEGHVINRKKKAATSRPSNNRFWPASLVAAAAIHPVAAGLASTAGGCGSSSTFALHSSPATSSYSKETTNHFRGSDDASDSKERRTLNYNPSSTSLGYSLDNDPGKQPIRYDSTVRSVNLQLNDRSKFSSDYQSWGETSTLQDSRENQFSLNRAKAEKQISAFNLEQEHSSSSVAQNGCTKCHEDESACYTDSSPNHLVMDNRSSNTDITCQPYRTEEESPLENQSERKTYSLTSRCNLDDNRMDTSYNLKETQSSRKATLSKPENLPDQATTYKTYATSNNIPVIQKPPETEPIPQPTSTQKSIKEHSGVTSATLEFVCPVSSVPSGIQLTENETVRQFLSFDASDVDRARSNSSTNSTKVATNDLALENQTLSGKRLQQNPVTYHHNLLDPIQHYTNYSASNVMNIPCSTTSGDNSSSGLQMHSPYPPELLPNNPLSHLPHFHNPSFSATSLLSSSSMSKTDNTGTVFGGLTDHWITSNSAAPGSLADAYGGFPPLTSSWTSKLRRITPQNIEAASDDAINPAQLINSQLSPSPRAPATSTPFYSNHHNFSFFSHPDKNACNSTDYFRFTGERSEQSLKVNNYAGQYDYAANGLLPEFRAPTNLSNPYLSSSHSISP